ncbi:MAG: STAS domain-containing protein [Betaproteobacteria bacterium]|nr:STAS domain-containing protein [Betaproteobacteria bacterium]
MMQIAVKNRDDITVLHLNGRFDFSSHRDFKNAHDVVLQTEGLREVVVDLTEVEYMDSSALGMLLLLREKANLSNIDVSLRSCDGFVQQILEVANFQNIFNISPMIGPVGPNKKQH